MKLVEPSSKYRNMDARCLVSTFSYRERIFWTISLIDEDRNTDKLEDLKSDKKWRRENLRSKIAKIMCKPFVVDKSKSKKSVGKTKTIDLGIY